MAEEQIYDGVGCPADDKSDKTIFHPQQKGDIPIDGVMRRVIPPHSTDHKATPDGIPIREAGDTDCGQNDEIFGTIIRRDPPKDQAHPEKEESGKKEIVGI